jgi:hypothetical protein
MSAQSWNEAISSSVEERFEWIARRVGARKGVSHIPSSVHYAPWPP